MRAQKTCALREGLRYEEVGVVPIEHLAANNRKKINTVKTAIVVYSTPGVLIPKRPKPVVERREPRGDRE